MIVELRASAFCSAFARVLTVFALSACSGCQRGHSSTSTTTHASADPIRPPSQDELPTTDGAISMGNLDTQVVSAIDLAKRFPTDFDRRKTAVDLLLHRSKFTNRVSDLEAADAMANEYVAAAPKSAEAFETRAQTRASLHLFKQAVEDLDKAVELGAKKEDQDNARASILQANGDLDGALALRHAASERAPDIGFLTSEASLLGELGRTDDAARLFVQAPVNYREVSVFPVAWMVFQEAIMWERAGKKDRARAFYQEAYDRLPTFAHAASHLALLMPPERAIELLKPVVAAADDPEFELILGQSELAAGDKASADQHFAHVATRYDELIASHPEAYRDHAASFFLTEGNDKKKALDLSKQSLADGRRIASIYETALLAAVALGAKDDACSLAKGVKELQHPTSMLSDIARDACK